MEAAKRLVVDTEFFVRTAEEWYDVVARNPFREEAARDPGHLIVVFLKDSPDAKAVQAALHGAPMVIVYRVSPLTYRLLRRLVTVQSIGMVNLIAGERIVPELIQEAFTPATVAGEAISMLTDEERVNRIRAGLARVRDKLGGPGASRRAAEAILRIADTSAATKTRKDEKE